MIKKAHNDFWGLLGPSCSGLATTWTTSRRTRWRRRPTSTTSSPCRSTSSPLASPSWLGHQHFRNLFHQKDLETKNPYLVKRLSGTGGLVFYQVIVLVGGTLIWWWLSRGGEDKDEMMIMKIVMVLTLNSKWNSGANKSCQWGRTRTS